MKITQAKKIALAAFKNLRPGLQAVDDGRVETAQVLLRAAYSGFEEVVAPDLRLQPLAMRKGSNRAARLRPGARGLRHEEQRALREA